MTNLYILAFRASYFCKIVESSDYAIRFYEPFPTQTRIAIHFNNSMLLIVPTYFPVNLF